MTGERCFIEGMKTAPRFGERFALRNALVAREKRDTRYSVVDGNYSTERLLPVRNEFNRYPRFQWDSRTDPSVLMGLEGFYAKRIRELLQNAQDKPVIALDLGGGAGTSWIRLAGVFEEAISQGRLALAVSNLQPMRAVVDEAQTETTKFLSRYFGLVNFVTGDSLELTKAHLNLPGGRRVPLDGNVDLVHEKLSATYRSLIPEVDAVCIGGLLSGNGSYFSRNENALVASSHGFVSERTQGFQIGTAEMVKRFGLLSVPKVERGYMAGLPISDYTIFREPGAEPITIGAFEQAA